MHQDSPCYERYENFIINKSQCLGSGNYGHVYKGYLIGKNKSLQAVAIKQSYNQAQNIQEIRTLQILKHPNIIRYIDYKVSGKSILMVMQLCTGGTLDDLLFETANWQPESLIQYYSQIVKGVKFMYDKKILHRDIKPSNLLIKNNVIKIADFGTSKMQTSHELRTLVGTPLFFSPQLFQMSLGAEDKYTEKSEIWSLGLILYYMFNYDRNHTGAAQRIKSSLPWKGKNIAQLFKNIANEKLSFKNDKIPGEIKQIISRMLQIDVKQRMSFSQFFSLKIFQTEEPTVHRESEKAEERTINEISQQIIDQQLQQLLSLKNKQNQVQEQIEEYRQFYEMVISQVSEVYEAKYSELVFELQFQYYQITNSCQEKQRIKDKYYQRRSLFENGIKDQKPINCMDSCQEMVKNQTRITLGYKPSIDIQIVMPRQKLIKECQIFIKDNIDMVTGISSPTIKKKNLRQFINLLFTVYDFFTLLTLEKSWEMKRKSKMTVRGYKSFRNTVSLDKLVARIKKAVEVVPL